jgi:hypothetical protein
MPEQRPMDDLASLIAGEVQRFLRPPPAPVVPVPPADRESGTPPQPAAPPPPLPQGPRIEPIVNLLMTAARESQAAAQRRADASAAEAARAAAAAQPVPDAGLIARVAALEEHNRALERQLARLEGYIEGLRAQLAATRP